MKANWIPEIRLDQKSNNSFIAKLTLGTDSSWFDGHFPNKPILPAVAFLFLVLEVLRQALHDPALYIQSIPRSRIRGLVLPGQPIEIKCEVQPKNDGGSLRAKFELLANGHRVGDGKIDLARTELPRTRD